MVTRNKTSISMFLILFDDLVSLQEKKQFKVAILYLYYFALSKK